MERNRKIELNDHKQRHAYPFYILRRVVVLISLHKTTFQNAVNTRSAGLLFYFYCLLPAYVPKHSPGGSNTLGLVLALSLFLSCSVSSTATH